MRPERARVVVLGAVAAVVVCAGLVRAPAPTAFAEDARSTQAKGSSVFTFAGHCRTVDPAMIGGPDDERVVLACGEGLTRVDPATGAIGPGAADSWTVSPDGKTWTFHLRERHPL